MYEPKKQEGRAAFCFILALIEFLLIAGYWGSPREEWLKPLAIIAAMSATIGGGIGATYGHLWVGIVVGLLAAPILLLLAISNLY